MAILWCGGEDTDWMNLGSILTTTTGTSLRTGYARQACKASSGQQLTKPIATPLTSGWFSFRGVHGSISADQKYCGIGRSGTNKGLLIGSGAGSSSRTALWKYDGSTFTKLAEEVSSTMTGNVLHKFDIELVSYGAASTVRVYVDGSLVITYVGDTSIAGVDGFDCFNSSFAPNGISMSELIIADEDSRLLSVVTLAPNAAGDESTFTSGAYTDIDEVALNDADLISSAVAEQVAQFNLTTRPAGDFIVKAVKVAARCADGVGGMAIQVGIKTNGAEHLGAQQTLGGAWQTIEQLYTDNPETLNRFTLAELDALQIAFRSKAA